MKTKTKLDYIPEAIRYLCLAVVIILGLFSIMATGGGGDSSGSSSGTTLVSEARVLVLSSSATADPIQGARVRGVFLYRNTNLTEESNCVTGANGRCIVSVAVQGQLADEVSLDVSQPGFGPATNTSALDSTGSVNVTIRLTPNPPPP